MDKNILIIVQARTEATRLPGKVLLLLAGQPMILWLLSRLSRLPYPLVVAIPDTPANIPLADLCGRHGYQAHLIPGDPADVLARFVAVAELYPDAEHIVRVCADCPLLDPAVIEDVIIMHTRGGGGQAIIDRGYLGTNTRVPSVCISLSYDYTGLAREWGDGIADCEVFTRDALLLADSAATVPHEREHVSPWLWIQPQRFKVSHYPCPFDLSWMRCSVDTKEDFLHIQMLLEACLARYGMDFGWREVWWTVEQNATLREYMAQKPMNQAYLAQVGSAKEWGEERYAQ